MTYHMLLKRNMTLSTPHVYNTEEDIQRTWPV